jgi:hypothetical protein
MQQLLLQREWLPSLQSAQGQRACFSLPVVRRLAAVAACPDHFRPKSWTVQGKTVRAGPQTLKLASLRQFQVEMHW